MRLQDEADCYPKTLTYSKWKADQDRHMEKVKQQDAFQPSNPPWVQCVLTQRYMCMQQRKDKRRHDAVVANSVAESAKRRQKAFTDTEKALDQRYRVYPMFGENV